MRNTKLRIVNYVIAVCNLLLAGVFYPLLPDRIPMNWSFDGTAAYSAKYEIFLMCGMGILIAFLLDVLPKIDPRRQNYQKFSSYYDSFCIVIQLFLLAMTGIILTESFRPGTVSVQYVVMLAVGLLFMYIGNIMPKFKSNFFCGVKTPWALSSEEIWRKSQRLGGKCFFIAGILIIFSMLLPGSEAAFAVVMAAVFAAVLIPSVMSYVWWRQEQNSEKH